VLNNPVAHDFHAYVLADLVGAGVSLRRGSGKADRIGARLIRLRLARRRGAHDY
jgi:hypothetical protein